MAECSAAHLAARGNIPKKLDAIRIGWARGIQLLKSAFDTINHRSKGYVAGKARSAIAVQAAYGSPDLIVFKRSDVLHEEVNEPGIPLQNAKYLQSAVAHVDLRNC